MPEKITIDFDETGNPSIEVKGHNGKGCKAITKPIEDALGGVVLSDETTAEYAQQPLVVQRQEARR